MSAFLISGLIFVMVLNFIIFYFAYKYQTDKLTDITYSISFASLTLFAALYADIFGSVGKMLMATLILLWAIRLGWYLLARVSQLGKDDRFDDIRTNKKRFLRFFLIQGFASWIVSLPALIRLNFDENLGIISSPHLELAGLLIAFFGLIMEASADYSKSQFKKKEGNKHKLYTTGWFKYIRYPNYTGEIVFWTGIFIASMPFLSGLQWLSVIGLVFIIFLLLKVSGIPMLEKSRMERHKNDPEYLAYLDRTKKIIPGIY